MKKIAYIIIALLFLPTFAFTLRAQDDFASGNGTAANPYIIKTVEHLSNVRKYTGEKNADVHFAMDNDIDLSAISNWEPIGFLGTNYYDDTLVFFGKFDGRGHVVRNMTVKPDANEIVEKRRNLGLFGYTKAGSVIENLGVENGYIEIRTFNGGLLCGSNGGRVENCWATGKIKCAATQVGGLIGNHSTLDRISPAIVKNCYTIVEIESTHTSAANGNIGGIAGRSVAATISNCYTLCYFNANYTYEIGGICGLMARGRVEKCYTYGYAKGLARVGGILGQQLETNYTTNCYSSMTIEPSPYTKNLADPYVKKSFGGILGGSYSTVEVIKDCYFNKDIFAGEGIGMDAAELYLSGTEGLTTEEMKKEELFVGAGWKFGTTWNIWEDHTFPFLDGLITPAVITDATPAYIEGIFKNDDIPDKIQLYSTSLKLLGEAILNKSNNTWRIDLTAPINVNEYVYAIAFRNGTPTSPTVLKVANTYFNGGDGSASTPFRISTPEQLRNLRFYMGEEAASMHFVLINDLNFKNEPVWTPLRSDESKTFCGTIDGAHFAIKNINIEGIDSVGLFSILGSKASISNFKLLGCKVNGNDVVGGICAINNGSIKKSFVQGKVNGRNNVGGFAAVNNNTLENCFNMAAVTTSGTTCGGFCAINSQTGTISKCYSMGDVSGSSKVGGFCGTNAGSVELSFSSNVVTGSSAIAGFCTDNTATVTACFFDKQLANTDNSVASGNAAGITGLSTSDMKKKTSYKTWSFTSILADWGIWESNTLPYFATQAAPPVITNISSSAVQGISTPINAPDSIVLYKNHERMGACAPGVTSWQIPLGNNPLNANDLLYVVAYLTGKEASRPAFAEGLPNDASLKALGVNEANLIPLFSPMVLNYTVKPLETTVDRITITATAANAKATIKGAGMQALKIGTNKFVVEVTSEDGTVTNSYAITIIRKDAAYKPSNDPSLKMLNASVVNGSLITDFTPERTNYTGSVLNSVEQITLTAEPVNPYATVSGTGVKNLNVGENIFVVTGIAEDGTTKKDYTVTITRQTTTHTASNNASLQMLSINQGTLSPAFASSVYSYVANVSGAVSEINIMATPAQTGALISGAGLKPLRIGVNLFTITVTAEDGISKKNYTLTINRAMPSEAQLKGISVSNTDIDCSNGSSFSYLADCGVATADIRVEANEGTSILINGQAQNACTVAIPESGFGQVNITLISGDQLQTKHYELILMRPLPAGVISLRWNNILALTNNPSFNGGYNFQAYQWYKNGVAITGETKPYIRIDGQPVQYKVEAITTDGYKLHTCPLNSVVKPAQAGIVAYPNPVQAGADLQIELPDNGRENAKSTITILTPLGQVKKVISLTGHNASISVPTQPGLYIIQVTDENKQTQTSNILVY